MSEEELQAQAPESETTDQPEAETEHEEPGKQPEDTDSDNNEQDTQEDGEHEGEGDDQPEAELAEVEYDGKSYKVPPELREAFLRHDDYTRKTQAIASEREQVQQAKRQIGEIFQVTNQEVELRGIMSNLDSQIAEFQQTDWEKLEEEDPYAAQSKWRQYQALRDGRNEAQQMYQQTVQQRTALAEQDYANRRQQTAEYAQKNIKGWNRELDNKLTQFCQTDIGLSQADMKDLMSPRFLQMVHLAYHGKQALTKSARPKPQKQPIQPTTKVRGGSAPKAGLHDNLSQKEWMRRRWEQVQRKRTG